MFRAGDVTKLKNGHSRAGAIVKVIREANELDIKHHPFLKGYFVVEFIYSKESMWVTPACLEEIPWSVS